MRGRDGTRARPALPSLLGGFALLAALAAGTSAARVAAQDATPAADAGASPVAIASPAARTVDCADVLGLEPGSACVLLVHAAAGAPTIDVAVDGETAADGLDFGRASSYLALPPGEHQIRLSEAGTDEALLDLSLAFEAGLAYEVVAYIQDDAPTAAILSTNLDPLADDRARVRVFQAIPGAPPSEVALAGGETLIAGVEYGSATGYAEVPTGETPVDLEVRPAGAPIVFPIPGATLEPGLVYTFYALGDLADPGSLGVLPVVAPAAGAATDGTPVPAAEPIPLSPGNPGTPAATPAA